MNVLHVLHESFIAQEELVAQRAASRIGPTNKGRMLSTKKFKLVIFFKRSDRPTSKLYKREGEKSLEKMGGNSRHSALAYIKNTTINE